MTKKSFKKGDFRLAKTNHLNVKRFNCASFVFYANELAKS